MLNDTTSFKKIYIATGYTDLRQGIDGLASFVKLRFNSGISFGLLKKVQINHYV